MRQRPLSHVQYGRFQSEPKRPFNAGTASPSGATGAISDPPGSPAVRIGDGADACAMRFRASGIGASAYQSNSYAQLPAGPIAPPA